MARTILQLGASIQKQRRVRQRRWISIFAPSCFPELVVCQCRSASALNCRCGCIVEPKKTKKVGPFGNTEAHARPICLVLVHNHPVERQSASADRTHFMMHASVVSWGGVIQALSGTSVAITIKVVSSAIKFGQRKATKFLILQLSSNRVSAINR